MSTSSCPRPVWVTVFHSYGGFAFSGSESVTYMAGNAKVVEKTASGVVNGVFWSIILFYLWSTFVILHMCLGHDEGLGALP